MRKIVRRRLLLSCALVSAASVIAPAATLASAGQQSIFSEGLAGTNTSPVLQELRHLGAGVIRFNVQWAQIAPNPSSAHRPKFNASDPGAYPAANWTPVDNVVRTATADGIKVMLTVTGHAPRWAFGPGEPPDPMNLLGAWKPSASEYGKFVQAVGKRYSGHYRGLPAVRIWDLYNEPNFGEDLSPQSQGSVLTSADMYRGLLANGWRALHASGHGGDTILFGSLSAHGQNVPRVFGEAKPLQFLRELYCLDSGYHPFRGRAASIRGCPTTKSRFRSQNPALFGASAFSIHPYPLYKDMSVPPNRTLMPDKDYASFSQLPNLEKALDRAVGVYGSRRRYSLWNTEYGYITNPPTAGGASWSNQAYYLNWAEYLSWKSSRIVSFTQFLLLDPDLPSHFASGLLTLSGDPKPSLDAWRLPLYLPSTSTRPGRNLEVWGCVRPAPYAFRDTGQAQTGEIQFAAQGSPIYTTLQTVSLRGGSCYFDRKITFPSSGTVRLAYLYPLTDLALLPTFAYTDPITPAVSRSVQITVR